MEMSAVVTLLQLSWMLCACLTSQNQPLAIHSDQLASDASQMSATSNDAVSHVAPVDETDAATTPNAQPEMAAIGQESDPNGFSIAYAERLRHHIADPERAKQRAIKELESATRRIDVEPLEHLIKRISQIERPNKLRLTLEEALRRALESSYAIRVSSYNPAIEATRVVEAEAVFDATFFANLNNDKVDRPTANALFGSQVQTFNAQSGIRKLLATGMQVEARYSTQRTSNNFQFQLLNPQWFDQFVVQFRQPLLRGFGLDFNRSQIRLSKLGRRQATQTFRRQVRDTLRSTEEAYWRVAQARRNLVISARLLASFEQIYNFLDKRKDFDVYRIQLADTEARLERSKADFIQLVANVYDAEDQLIVLMNNAEIDLADNIEIIPVDVPSYQPLVIDRISEVQTALENRAEIVEAKLGIDSAKIQVGVAKNQALPQFDVTFRYSVDGLGASQGDAFDEVTKNDYTEYFLALEFELPVGNRARRAALQRAKLQHAQAIASLKQVFEQVILDVNLAVRRTQVSFDLIDPSLQSADAVKDQVDSIIARAEKKDFLTLNNELNTRQSLAQARSALLAALVDYGISVVDLERSKGTLLRYNNVELNFDDSDDPAN